MQNAIKKVCSVGYNTVKNIKYEGCENETVEAILLDQLFWQALGKAEGWEDNDFCTNCEMPIEGWKYHQYKLVEYINEGGMIDDFFNNLIK